MRSAVPSSLVSPSCQAVPIHTARRHFPLLWKESPLDRPAPRVPVPWGPVFFAFLLKEEMDEPVVVAAGPSGERAGAPPALTLLVGPMRVKAMVGS